MTDIRYPIGKFSPSSEISESQLPTFIQEIEELPQLLAHAVEGLTDEQLDTPYREGGWTVRQVIHHIADSHLNSYIRFRLALTEDEPSIKEYDEQKWAELRDAKYAPVKSSLLLIEGLHQRWVVLLRSLSPTDWKKAFLHPKLGNFPLDVCLALYAWHGKHHLAHMEIVKNK